MTSAPTLTVDLTDYRPTRTQARFLRARERFVGFFTGYGGGKTRAGAEKALRLALANPGCTGLIVAPTWQMLQRLSLDAFLTATPRDLVREHHKSERRIELVNGARIYFGSADRPGALEGTNVAWLWVDEARLVTSDAWRVLVGRLREKRARQLQAVVTTTPAMGWLADVFDRDAVDTLALHASTQENAHNLAHGFLDALRRSYSARLAKSLIDGEFSVIAGQVYEEFDEARHLVDWPADNRYRTLAFVDFGYRCPAVLFAQETGDFPTQCADGRVLPPRSIVVFDELHPDNVPTERLTPRIEARLGGRRLDAIYCDPAGIGVDQASGLRSVEILRAAFPGARLRYETAPRERDIPSGIARVQGALAPLDGEPTLYFDRKLKDGPARGVIRSLRAYRFDDPKDGRPVSDHPIKDGVSDHALDALRYGVINAQNARRDHKGGTVYALHGG